MEAYDGKLHDLNCAIIVAHPDDETLWAGGLVLMNPANRWKIVTACRKDDVDRSGRFFSAMKILNAEGVMGDLDDGPEQEPLESETVEEAIVSLLGGENYDLIITHSMKGEYTRHRRHEEVGVAVSNLIESGRLKAGRLWMFAYEDGGRKYLPRTIEGADIVVTLPDEVWDKKYKIITEIYGFDKESWEAKTTPCCEAFWDFRT